MLRSGESVYMWNGTGLLGLPPISTKNPDSRSPNGRKGKKGGERGSEREHERQKGHIIILFLFFIVLYFYD